MDKRRGAANGYIYDGIHKKGGHLHYTGEGRSDDQQMIQGNRAIRDHRKEGRALHVFDVRKPGVAFHLGEFEYVAHYGADAPQPGSDQPRAVIVFKLRRLSGTSPLPIAALRAVETGHWVKEIPIERHLTDETVIKPNAKPRKAQRREQKLVKRLENWLQAAGHEVCRLELHAKSEPAPIRCDLFDKTTKTIVEAKSSVARASIRMAIGQLADYSRLMTPPPRQRQILVPQRPRPDLLELAKSQSIGVIWPDGDGGFAATSPAAA